MRGGSAANSRARSSRRRRSAPPPPGSRSVMSLEAERIMMTTAPGEENHVSWRRLLARPEMPSLIFLSLLILMLAVTTPGFFTFANLRGVVEQVAVVSIVALAVNQVILAGEI